jgi:hypothetical protein
LRYLATHKAKLYGRIITPVTISFKMPRSVKADPRSLIPKRACAAVPATISEDAPRSDNLKITKPRNIVEYARLFYEDGDEYDVRLAE